MKLGNVRDHIAKHNWFAVAIDLFIVMIGVFLGMQVNNWNQDRLDREQGQVYYRRIADDLATDIAVWRASSQYYQAVQNHAKAALAALRQPNANLGSQFLIDAYQATQIIRRGSTRSAYDEAVSRGVFNDLGDADIRSRVTNYYVIANTTSAVFDPIAPYRERLRRLMPYEVTLSILAHCGDVYTTGDSGVVMVALPQTCDPQLSPMQIRQAVTQIRADSDLALDLNRQISNLTQELISYQLILTTAQDLRRDMAAARP